MLGLFICTSAIQPKRTFLYRTVMAAFHNTPDTHALGLLLRRGPPVSGS